MEIKFWRLRMGLSLVLLPLLMSVSLATEAHRKTDVITMKNGDRLTGEIVSLISGRLTLNTDAMGLVRIEWKEIAGARSNFNYELRLNSGERFFGSLAAGSESGVLAFSDVFGKQYFDWLDVVELRPVEEEFEDRLEVYLSANYAFTKASGVTQTELRADVSYEDEKARNALNSRATVSDTDTETTTSSRVAASRRVWTDRESLYRTVFGGYESNDELALDYRLTVGGGFGRYFIDTNNSNLNGSLSIQALDERSIGGDRQESIEGVVTVGYTQWRFDSPELNLQFDASLYPSLTERGRLRADTNATVRWEIVNDLSWNINLWGSYDNEAIDDAAGQFDWGVTTGLGWDF